MPDYNSSYTGPQIDEAVGKALSPDTTPTQNSSNLVTSGGVQAALPPMPRQRWYGRCDSAADASERAVSIEGITSLSTGLVITVLMITAQHYNGSPTLNVNNLGALPIRRRYASDQYIGKYEWQAGAVLEFYYVGYWVLIDGGHSTSNFYGLSRGSSDSPLMNGIASTGESDDYARGDHVHPHDSIKANQAELAILESGTTASRAYGIGEYFTQESLGRFLRVTAPISSGETFTEGTNCEYTTVGTELQSLGAELQSIIKTFDLAAGKSLTIQPRNSSAQLTCILASNGVRTSTAILYYLSLYSAGSNYHIIHPIVTATSVSVSDSGGITTITNNHASDVVRILLLTLYTTGTVYYNIV